MFDAEKFLLDNNIEYTDTGKNVSPGWVGLACPLCNDHSTHGGFQLGKSRYACWRCGSHWIPKVISKLLNVNFSRAKRIFKQYSSGNTYINKKQETECNYIDKIVFPNGTQQLTQRAKDYLISRNFNPEDLAREWGLMSTGNIGDYKFRILAPIYLNGVLISYQCRDITGKANTPYLPCRIDQSVYNFEYSLYGIDKAVQKSKKCVVVEGITDVWRLGPGSLGTFGINFTNKQVQLLSKTFDEIFILFDPEDQAQEQADKLFFSLRGYNKKCEVLTLDSGDPGDLPDDEAQQIMKEIGL
jgi:DNA primase